MWLAEKGYSKSFGMWTHMYTCRVLLHHPASWVSTSRSWVLAMRYGGPLMRPGSRASSRRRRGSWPMWDTTRLPAFSFTSSVNATNAASSASGEPAMWEGLTFLQKAGTFLVPGSWCDDLDHGVTHSIWHYVHTYILYIQVIIDYLTIINIILLTFNLSACNHNSLIHYRNIQWCM